MARGYAFMPPVIVLTGTIIPNAPLAAHRDAEKRKEEYLTAINFYKQFAQVYFLENSAYPVLNDPDFMNLEGVILRKLPPSEHPERGKGYQEFEMIDAWVASEVSLPRGFIKVTGRYIVSNIEEIIKECQSGDSGAFIIDRFPRSEVAITRLFYIQADYYRRHLLGVYRDCHDMDGRWVERVLYRRLLEGDLKANFFFHEPSFSGVEGGTGILIAPDRARYFIKAVHRRINWMFEKRYLLCRKGPV